MNETDQSKGVTQSQPQKLKQKQKQKHMRLYTIGWMDMCVRLCVVEWHERERALCVHKPCFVQ